MPQRSDKAFMHSGLTGSSLRIVSCAPGYKSCGDNPVCFAMRANMRGPISSSSWKAKTKSGQPGRERVRCDPDWRLTVQPKLRKAAKTRLVFDDGQWVMQLQELKC